MFSMTFNGTTNAAHGLKIASRPSIPAPEKRGSLISVAGRDGALLETDGAFEPITIDIALNYTGDPDTLGAKFRTAKAWLQGSGSLSFSDDPAVFYRVIQMGVTDHNRRGIRGADLTATAICDPYTYITAGQTARTGTGSVLNSYDVSKPMYTITGNGTAVLTVNGNALTCVVGQKLTIDTDKMMAYKDNAVMNAVTSGADYDELWLQPGTNTINLTSGFTLSYIPNWRLL